MRQMEAAFRMKRPTYPCSIPFCCGSGVLLILPIPLQANGCYGHTQDKRMDRKLFASLAATKYQQAFCLFSQQNKHTHTHRPTSIRRGCQGTEEDILAFLSACCFSVCDMQLPGGNWIEPNGCEAKLQSQIYATSIAWINCLTTEEFGHPSSFGWSAIFVQTQCKLSRQSEKPSSLQRIYICLLIIRLAFHYVKLVFKCRRQKLQQSVFGTCRFSLNQCLY